MEKNINSLWVVTETTHLSQLVIEPGGALAAPEGKFVTMTVNGRGRKAEPGVYSGDIVLTVADEYIMPPHGLFLAIGKSTPFHDTLVVTDNQIDEAKGVPALIRKGEVTPTHADGVQISSNEESFNGILLTGSTEYTINGANIELDGFSGNDFVGLGAGITAIDDAKVTINDSRVVLHGVTRCAVHVGGDSVVTANRCTFVNHSPENDEWMGEFSWGCAFDGTNRLVQLCDNGTAYYNDCDFDTNGWGIASIDGCDDAVAYYFKDCRMNCSGARSHGYGSFCIGDRNVVSFDHSQVHCTAYNLIQRGMIGAAKSKIVNGCDFTSDHFNILCLGDKESVVNIADSSLTAASSVIAAKGSATTFNVSRSHLKGGNGTILQLMDNDECGMFIKTTVLPVGKVDVYDPSHDLYKVDTTNDVIMNLADMEVQGNFLNSTTNLHLEHDAIPGHCDKPPAFGGMFEPPEGSEGMSFLDAPEAEGNDHAKETEYDADLRGPKNLVLNLKNVRYEGIASAATAAYRDGLTEITEATRYELSCVTQTPAPTVNNGVIVTVDGDSSWIVTGTSYITSLMLAENGIVKAQSGKKVVMTVDGVETEVKPGNYTGHIVLTPVQA